MKKTYKKHPFICISIAVIILSMLGATILSIFLMVKSPAGKKENYSLYTVRKEADSLFKGNVVANTSTIYTQDTTLGDLSQINVTDGQKVKVGDALLTYTRQSDNLLTQQFAVKSAENNLNNAQADLTEVESKDATLRLKLVKAKNEEEKQVLNDQVETNNAAWKLAQRAVTAANLALEEAQTSLTNQVEQQTTTVTSKTAGVVVIGTASETSPLLSVVSQETFVQGKVSEYDYDKIKVNDVVKIETVDLKQTVTGKISYLSPVPEVATDASSSSYYNFKVILDETLQNGYTVQIHLANTAIYIPKTSIKAGQVYVKNGHEFRKTKVEVKEVSGRLQVISGLKMGDKIIKEVADDVDYS